MYFLLLADKFQLINFKALKLFVTSVEPVNSSIAVDAENS